MQKTAMLRFALFSTLFRYVHVIITIDRRLQRKMLTHKAATAEICDCLALPKCELVLAHVVSRTAALKFVTGEVRSMQQDEAGKR